MCLCFGEPPGKRGLCGSASTMPDTLSDECDGVAASVTPPTDTVATTSPPYATSTSNVALPTAVENHESSRVRKRVSRPSGASTPPPVVEVSVAPPAPPVALSVTTRPVPSTSLLPPPSRSCTATITRSRSLTRSLARYTVAVRSTAETVAARARAT